MKKKGNASRKNEQHEVPEVLMYLDLAGALDVWARGCERQGKGVGKGFS